MLHLHWPRDGEHAHYAHVSPAAFLRIHLQASYRIMNMLCRRQDVYQYTVRIKRANAGIMQADLVSAAAAPAASCQSVIKISPQARAALLDRTIDVESDAGGASAVCHLQQVAVAF